MGEQIEIENKTPLMLGNCVHACMQQKIERGSIDYQLVDNYISTLDASNIDISLIREQYPIMTQAIIDQYLKYNKPSKPKCEEFVYYEVIPGIYASGSIDMYSEEKDGVITDWKTMGSLDSARVPTSFPRAYYFQQLTYAWILNKLGRKVNYCKLIFVSRNNTNRISQTTNKALKDYPSTVTELIEPITKENMEFIDGVINLIANSINTWNNEPDLRYLLAQDWRLHKPKPVLFK